MITTETMFHTISNIGTELPKPQCLYRQSYILLVAVEEKKKKNHNWKKRNYSITLSSDD